MVENPILRNQIDARVQLTDSERKEFAEIGAKLGKQAPEEITTVAKPDTILAWNRKVADQQVDTSEPPKSVGRLCVDKEMEELMLRMVREHRSWGYDRIQGALKYLGYIISDQTVGNILKRHGISPAPKRKKTVTWRKCVRSHMDVLLATDCCNSDIWSGCGLIVTCLLSFIHVGRHQGHAMGMMLHQQLLGLHLISRSLDLHPHMPRWAHMLKEPSRARRLGKTVVEHPLVRGYARGGVQAPISRHE